VNMIPLLHSVVAGITKYSCHLNISRSLE
jgi:hypothetical protein